MEEEVAVRDAVLPDAGIHTDIVDVPRMDVQVADPAVAAEDAAVAVAGVEIKKREFLRACITLDLQGLT